MSALYETLHKIKQKPGMYLGTPSLTALRFFLEGYEFARDELGIKSTEQELEFHGEFQSWLQKKFNLETVSSWAKVILFYSADEKAAFTYFFDLLDEFLQRHQILEGTDSQVTNGQINGIKKNGSKTELMALLDNLSEDSLVQVREFAESLKQRNE